jgi:uncharacterized protein YjbI with pentapeptide repeats
MASLPADVATAHERRPPVPSPNVRTVMAGASQAVRAPRLTDGRQVVELELLRDDDDWSCIELRGSLADWQPARVTVDGCRLLGCSLIGASLEGARIRDTLFEDCDLTGIVLAESKLTRVEFVNCRIAAVDLGAARLDDVRFAQCKLDGASFRMSAGERVEFADCGLATSDFTSAKLKSARFLRCDLSHGEFSGANLDGARLHGSALDDLRGVQSLRRVVIDSTQAIPLALSLLGASGISIDDAEDP